MPASANRTVTATLTTISAPGYSMPAVSLGPDWTAVTGGTTLKLARNMTGLLALNKSETIYYEANEDSAGQALDGKCSYRIDGKDPDARWWSITVYGTDHFLLPNPGKRFSVTKTEVVRGADGAFSARLSTTPEDGNWIATSEHGFEITLRLYNPGDSVRDRPDAVPLPSITREACS